MPDQDKLRVGSVCSGVGGFELGLHRADPRFDVRWMCEFLERRRSVLNRHWPGVPVHPDITELDPDDLEPIDFLVGGTPCQDLSVAGKRAGLEGEKSGLFWHFIRLRNSLVPRWTLWENVPGALSSNDGLDFALVLGAFVGAQLNVPAGGWTRSGVAAGPWGGCVWRVLNSQHFGVPQRRHRVFVVGHFGGMVPSEVLLEREGSAGDSAAREEARASATRDAGEEPKRPGSIGTPGGVTQSLTTRFGSTGPDLPDAEGGWLVDPDQSDVAGTVRSHMRPGSNDVGSIVDVAPALTSRYYKGVPSDGDDAVVYEQSAPDAAAPLTRGSAAGEGVSEPGRRQEDDVNLVSEEPVAFVQNQREELREVDQAMALSSQSGTHQETRLADGPQVRRLTPTECERLQGFPDGWTIPQGASLLDAPSHYQLADILPTWERWTPFTKRHAANTPDDYESWTEADVARTMVDGRLNANLAVDGVIHSDAIGRSGDAKTPSPDAEGRVRLRDPGLGISDDDQAPNLTTGKPHAVGIRTEGPLEQADRIHNSEGQAPPLQAQVDRSGASAAPLVSHALTSEGLEGAVCVLDPPPDAGRYAAMGDAVTVPVISFIGSRIAAIEDGKDLT